jgi:hypothetical protein
MRKCTIGCLHKQLVLEYYDAVDARDTRRESQECLQMETDEFDDIHPKVLFKDWLIGRKGKFSNPIFD